MKTNLPCGKVVTCWKDNDGYLIIKQGGKGTSLHRYIYKYFKGEIPKGMTVNHKDGNKYNNDISNLELMTFSENAKHAWKNNLCDPCVGERHGRAVLDDMKVLTILTMPKRNKNGTGCGLTNQQLSDHFGVSISRISGIKNGREWKHITTK